MAANDDTTGRMDEAAGDGAPISTGDNPAGDAGEGIIGGTDSGQVAQAGGAEPVGTVESLTGTAFAVRADGTRVELKTGDPIYQGDTLETSADGSLGAMMADQTTFSMASGGQMVIDQMVYDPGTNEGSISMSVVEGVFTFVSGQIAKTDPDAMSLNTPVATIGIRGTQVGIEVGEDKPMNVVLMEEADGFVGEVVVANDGGVQILNQAFQATNVASSSSAPSESYIYDTQAVIEAYRGALSSLPTTNDNNANNYGTRPDDVQREQTQEEQTQNENLTDEQLAEEEATGEPTQQEGGEGEGEGQQDEQLAQEETGEPSAEELSSFEVAAGGEEGADPEQLAEEGDQPPPDDGFGEDQTDVLLDQIDLNLLLVPPVPVPPPNDPVQTGDLDNDEPEQEDDEVVIESTADGFADFGAGNVDGIEDGEPVTLDLSASLADTDGSEALSVTISGIPAGASLSFGTDNGDGSWDITSAADLANLSNLQLTPPDDYYGQLNLTFSATATEENGDKSVLATTSFVVDVAAVDDAPIVEQSELASGTEDDSIDLNLDIEMDGETTEKLDSVTISGIPADPNDPSQPAAELAFGTDDPLTLVGPDEETGLFSVTITDQAGLDEIGSLNITPIDGASANIPLSISAVSTDGGTTVFNTTVGITAEADEGTVAGSGSGNQGEFVPLKLQVEIPEGDDDTVQVVTITDLPDFAALSVGSDSGLTLTPIYPTFDDDEPLPPNSPFPIAYEITGSGTDGSFTAANIEALANGGLTVRGATADDPGFDLQVSVTTQDVDPDTGAVQTTSDPTTVNVEFVDENLPPVVIGGTDESLDEDTLLFNGQIEATDPNNDDLAFSLVEGTEPEHGTLNLNIDGSYEYTPDPDYFGPDSFTVEIDDGEGGVITQEINLTIDSVDDKPVVTLTAPADGLEDTAIDLNLNIAMENTTEDLAEVTISGIPADADLAFGTDNPLALTGPDGSGLFSVTISGNDLNRIDELNITPPEDSSDDFSLTVDAVSTDGGTTQVPVPVTVTGVADTPNVGASNVSGDEDTAIDLDITASLEDTDGSETLSVTIFNIPTGAALSLGSDNGDGSWTIPSEQIGDLADLTITPPQDFFGTMSLVVQSTATENDGDTAISGGQYFTVTVEDTGEVIVGTPDNDALVGGEQDDDISGLAGNDTIDGGAGDDIIDGGEGIDHVFGGEGDDEIDGGQDSDILHGEEGDDFIDGGQGDDIIFGGQGDDDIEGGQGDDIISGGAGDDVIDGGQGLDTAVFGGNYDDFNIVQNPDGTVTVSDTVGTGGDDVLSDVETLSFDNGSVAIADIGQPPEVSISPASGDESTDIPLNVFVEIANPFADLTEITIDGVPTGATLSLGTDNGDGSWTISDPAEFADLANLTISPVDGDSTDLNLAVSATVEDIDLATGQTASFTSDPVFLPVTVDAVVDEATVTTADATDAVEDGGAIDLDITASLPGGSDDTITEVTISNVPAGAQLSAGTDNGDGTWTLSAGDLNGLQITPEAGSSTDFTLQVSATSQDVDPETGAITTTTNDVPLTVNVAAVADEGTVAGGGAGVEDGGAIALNLTTSIPGGDDDTVESITISGLPAGATLSAGTDNGDGTFTVDAADIAGLTVTPAAGSSADFSLDVSVTTQDIDPETGAVTTTSTPTSIDVTVDAVADEGTVAGGGAGDEDTAIDLNLTTSIPGGDDDTVETITISGLPAGATLSAGTDNGDGTFTVDAADIAGLTVTPPAGDSTDFALSVSVTTQDIDPETGAVTTTSSATPINVQVDAVVGEATVTTQDATVAEDNSVALDITATLPGGSDDTITEVTISGVPAGATLSAGTDNGDGSWTLTPAQLTGLSITPEAGSSDDFTLQVNATSQDVDPETGAISTTTTDVPLNVQVNAVADTGTVAGGGAGGEGEAIALNLTTNIPGGDDDTVESVTISNLPAGATLSAGTDNGDGTFTVDAADIAGLTITPPAGSSADFSIDVAVTTQDIDPETGAVTTTSTPTAINIDVAASASEGVVTGGGVGGEDTAIDLNLLTSIPGGDDDVVESVTISGLPAGASLSAGTDNGDGTFTVDAADIATLQITPPAGSAVDFDIQVAVTTSDTDPDTGEKTFTTSSPTPISVAVDAVADEGAVAGGGAGAEDAAIALNLSTSIPGGDDDTVTEITLSGLPAGATLSAGTDNGDGTFTVQAADIAGLTITPPAGSSADFSIDVAVTTQDVDPDTGAISTTTSAPTAIGVQVDAVAEEGTVAGGGTGAEDTTIDLNLTTSIPGGDDDTVTEVTISGLPAGATLSHGTDNGDGTWTVPAADIGNVGVNPPAGSSADFNLDVTVTTQDVDPETGAVTTTSTPTSIAVQVDAVADEGTVAGGGAGAEDTAIALNLTTSIPGGDDDTVESITISGLPAGATLSAGTDNGDGTFTVDAADIAGLTVTPPAGSSADFNLDVTVTTQDIDPETGAVTTTSTPTSIDVTVDAVADEGTVAGGGTGAEDTAIALNLTTAIPGGDDDTVESITISGLPAGATLSAGTDNGDGTFTVDAADIAGLTVTPPAGDSTDFALSVSVTTQDIDPETGAVTTTSSATPINVQVDAVATEATVTTQAASGDEDTAIDLNITATLPGGSDDTITEVTISGVPAGANLSAGTDNGDGTWTLSPNDLNGLQITPPADSNVDFTLQVTATSEDVDPETGAVTTTSTAVDLPVTVLGVADDPTVGANNVSGDEDTAIPLDISAGLTDTDGSEALSVTIDGIPAGSVLSLGTDNGDGSWTISDPAEISQLSNLTFTPPQDFFGDINLAVSSTATEDDSGDTATTGPVNFTVSVSDTGEVLIGTPDDDVLTGGDQDDFIDGKSGDDTLTGGDGDDEILGRSGDDILDGGAGDDELDGGSGDDILLGGEGDDELDGGSGDDLLDGGVGDDDIDAGSGDDTVLAGDGNDDIDAGSGDDTITGGAGDDTIDGGQGDDTAVFGGNFDDYTIVVYENGDVTITGPDGTDQLTEIETLQFDNGSVDVEDIGLPPIISVETAQGDEDSAIALEITAETANPLANVETVTIEGIPAGSTLISGTDELQPEADGSYLLSPSQLQGLELTPPQDFNGDLSLEVTASTSEGLSSEAPTILPVNVIPVDDAPEVSVTAADGVEDDEIDLDISAAVPDSTETVESITIDGVPAGATLSAGTDNGDGSWTLSPAEVSDLTITPAAGDSTDFTLQVTAVSTDGGTSDPVDLNVTVDAVVGEATVTTQAASGAEDTAIDLNIAATLPQGSDDTITEVTISGVPAGAQLSAGTDNGDGSWTLSPADLQGLQVTPPSNSSADFTLQVNATTQDVDPETGAITTTTTDVPLNVTVDAVADLGSVSGGGTGDEDTAIALNLQASVPGGGDDDSVQSITISGLPAGATLSAGTDNGDGTFTVDAADIAGLTVTPPAGSSADFTLSLDVTTQDIDANTGAVTTTTAGAAPVTVQVNAVADEAGLAGGGAGDEDTAIALNIDTFIEGGDDDTVESITISGLPAGATLSAGTDNGDGTFTVDAADIANLTVTPPAGDSTDFTLQISATTQDVDPDTGAVSTTTSAPTPVNVVVDAVVDDATVTTQAASGDEDAAIDLNITASLPQGSDDTITEVTIEGVPAGAQLSAGTDNGDGTWTLSPSDLQGLQITPPAGSAADFTLQVNATTQDVDPETGAVTETSTNVPLNVTVDAVAEEGTVAGGGTGAEDTAIALNISTSIPGGDDDTVESITISGLPAGATLSAGTDNGDGTFTVDADDIAGLTVTPPAGDSTDFSLSVAVTTQDVDPETGAVTTTSTPAAINVQVNAVVGEATVTTQDVTADEDTAIALDITASLPQGSDDTITEVTIEGVPAGATLSAGTDNGDGSWTLSPSDLANLTVTPAAGNSADFTLQVNATTQDTDPETGAVTTTSTNVPLNVTVNAVADEATVTAQAASGDEDTAIDLNITASLPQGSDDTITEVTISGMPAGAELSAGTDNGDGSWTLSPADLQDLQVTPPVNSGADFTLQVSATSQDVDPETGAVTTTTQDVPLNVTVDAVADEPEITSVTLGEPTINEGDGGGLGSVSITNVGNASAGYHNSYGYYVMDENGNPTEGGIVWADVKDSVGDTFELEGVDPDSIGFFLIPNGDNVNSGLTDGMPVTFTQTASGEWFPVAPDGTLIQGQGDPALFSDPALNEANFDYTQDSASPGNQNWEDLVGGGDNDYNDVNMNVETTPGSGGGATSATFPLAVVAELADTDGSETLSVTIAGVPEGAELSAGTDNGDGTWTLTEGELAGLNITVPATETENFDLTITATSTDTDPETQAQTTADSDPAVVTIPMEDLELNTIFGTEGDDIIEGTEGDDTIEALDGDDVAIGGAGDDTIDGGAGDDILIGDAASPSAMYLLEEGSDSVVRLNMDGTAEVVVTQDEIEAATGRSDADFDDRGIAVDDSGNLLFTDDVSNSILMKPSDGGPLQVLVTEDAMAEVTGLGNVNPKSLTVGQDGMVYVSDDHSDSILQVDPATGSVVQFVSEQTLDDLPGITSVDLDGGLVTGQDGSIYAASDGNPDAIFEINPATGEASVLASNTPFKDLDVYMTVAPNGDLIVADDHNDTIYRVSTSGEDKGEVSVFLSEDQLEAVAGQDVDLEGGISFDADGNFYVAEENTDSVYQFTGYDENTGTIDGTGTVFVSQSALEQLVGHDPDLEGGMTSATEWSAINEEAGGDDVLIGGEGDDTIFGGGGNDQLDGGTGADELIGGYGDDALDGGTGFDTAFYAGNYDEYSIAIGDNGVVTISGPEGTDTLTNVENLDFKNGQVKIEDIGKAPTVETQAASGREDNAIGLGITVAVANPLALVTGVTITNIPAGSVLAAGTDEPFELTPQQDGTLSVTLTQDQLAGLNITPPQDYNGVFDLSVSATTSEGQTSNPVNYTVDVEAVNDAPELSGDGQIDVEDGAATISNQDMQLTDVDNSADELFYEVTDGPDHGDLYLDGNLLDEGDMFTQEDIDQGLLQYVVDEDAGAEFNHEWAEGTPEWAGTGRGLDVNPVDPSNLTMPDGGESVTINFESEGTSKNDVFGWYKIDENGNPGEASIIWGDTQDVDSGSSFTIEGLQPGESFGLFVVNDGADRASWLNNVPENHTLGFNEDGNLAQFNPAGNQVHETGRAKDVFGNSTSGIDEDGNLKVGFENTSVSSRDDFDDLVVSLQYNGQEGPATEDSFKFTAKDQDGKELEDRDGSEGGYSVSEGQASVNITIDPSGMG